MLSCGGTRPTSRELHAKRGLLRTAFFTAGAQPVDVAGLNERYKDPDLKVETWAQRFESEGCDVFKAEIEAGGFRFTEEIEIDGIEKNCVRQLKAGAGASNARAPVSMQGSRASGMSDGPVSWREDLFARLRGIQTARRGGATAPHKPLLLLWALARAQRDEPRLASYERDVEPDLGMLLAHFGAGAWKVSPSVPFWRLRNDDGLWEIPGAEGLTVTAKGDVHIQALREADTRGGFAKAVHQALRRDHGLVHEAARLLLHQHFPVSMHGAILAAVSYTGGLGASAVPPARFEEEVFGAYERRCAVCDFSLNVAGAPVALTAAHIMWPCAGGPHRVENGLVLCSTHRATWDRGVISLAHGHAGYRILVSTFADCDALSRYRFRRLDGELLRVPDNPSFRPCGDYTEWHRRHVFRG